MLLFISSCVGFFDYEEYTPIGTKCKRTRLGAGSAMGEIILDMNEDYEASYQECLRKEMMERQNNND